MKVKSEEGDK